MSAILKFRLTNNASDQVYPYLSQQGDILWAVIDEVRDTYAFPLQSGETFILARLASTRVAYLAVRLAGAAPASEQIAFLRDWRSEYAASTAYGGIPHRVTSYEIVTDEEFAAAEAQAQTHPWSNGCDAELANVLSSR